jgi:hypothetical protein
MTRDGGNRFVERPMGRKEEAGSRKEGWVEQEAGSRT